VGWKGGHCVLHSQHERSGKMGMHWGEVSRPRWNPASPHGWEGVGSQARGIEGGRSASCQSEERVSCASHQWDGRQGAFGITPVGWKGGCCMLRPPDERSGKMGMHWGEVSRLRWNPMSLPWMGGGWASNLWYQRGAFGITPIR
jgi:hypothetical protein